MIQGSGYVFRDPISRFLADNSLCIPLGQVVLLVALISLCILAEKHKLGLLVTYLFVFYWGFIFQSDYFVDLFGNTTQGFYAYIGFGLFMAVMCVVGFFREKITFVQEKEQVKKPLFKIPDSMRGKS